MPMTPQVVVWGDTYAANQESEGLFVFRNGTWKQLRGTGQTPKFRDAKQLERYIRRHYTRGGSR